MAEGKKSYGKQRLEYRGTRYENKRHKRVS